MLMNPLTILCLATGLTAGFRIPIDTPNGVYAVHKDAKGKAVFEAVSADPNSTETADPPSRVLRSLTKRGQTWCGCTRGVDYSDIDDAHKALQTHFGNGGRLVPSRGSYVSTKGSTAAFVCNYDGSDTTVRKNELVAGASTITGTCGWFIAGTVQLDGHPHLDFGYMNTFGGDVCGAAESSPAHSC